MVAVAVVALAACSGKDEAAHTPTLQLEPSSSTTSIATSTTTARTDLLIDHALDGFATVRDDTIDLDAAAAASDDSDEERSLLQKRGFVSGAVRTWSGPGDDVVLATTYELGSKEQAAGYLRDTAQTLRAHDGTPFDVPDIPGALGFSTTEVTFVAHAVAFTRGDRWYLVLVGSSTGTRTETEAAQLALLQAALAG